jgi:glycosyltransferase involved in cell wall biosynthesis
VQVPRKIPIDGVMTKSDLPLVSVICLCYNHSKYVVESIESVLSQIYENIELIIVDDASTDDSQRVISSFIEQLPKIKFIPLSQNVGNCRAFNIGWQASSGAYVIDLAADDILLPQRISIGIERFLDTGSDYGVHFGDARMIDKNGTLLKEHLTGSYFQDNVPEGILFSTLLTKYFINPATMMYSKPLLNFLGGYDESLAYEDFDLWVRSSKEFKYCYSNRLLINKRTLKGAHGGTQYRPGSKILKSTYRVCEKAFALCENSQEYQALLIRIKYEMKMAIFSFNWGVAWRFYKLRRKTNNAQLS